ncbi:hypothetical protein E5D57_012808 [Metarhizium anisopliae]|nr:hypothetical protein E5D57_012808 [Metarhizium anisopliae]
MAEFYRRNNPFEDSVSKSLADLNTQKFYSAMVLMPHITEGVDIPSETPRPTTISNGNFDPAREAPGYAVATSALELGFNALTFDGRDKGRLYANSDYSSDRTEGR